MLSDHSGAKTTSRIDMGNYITSYIVSWCAFVSYSPLMSCFLKSVSFWISCFMFIYFGLSEFGSAGAVKFEEHYFA